MRITEAENRRRPRFIFGPGIIAAIAIVIALAASGRFPMTPEQASKKPDLEGTVAETDRLGPTPAVGYILEYGDLLNLTITQEETLREISASQIEGTAHLERSLQDAADDLNSSLGSTPEKAGGKDMESVARRFAELSRKVSAEREKYWKKASGVLTSGQVEKLNALREKDAQAAFKRLDVKPPGN